MVRLGHIELFTTDPVASRHFYVDGIGLSVEKEEPGGFIWLSDGSAEILLRPGGPPPGKADAYLSSGLGMVFYADDLQATLRRLGELGFCQEGDDGPGCPTFRDPDGHWLQLVATSP